MTDPMPSGGGPDTQPIKIGTGERRRAAIALAVLAVGAIVLVAIMVYAFGSDQTTTSGTPTGGGNPSGPAVTVTGGPHTSSSAHRRGHQQPSHKPSHQPSSDAAPSQSVPATGGPSSCETSAPCELPTDVGNAVGAFNDYRAQHGVDPVSGAVTKAAQDCALANGETSSCPSGYFWEPVPSSGRQVIEKIAAQSSGPSWLLDKTITRIEVGWAYIPGSHSYEVAMVADH